jgi:hypothetical protein
MATIAEAKQRSQRSIIGWVTMTKIYYLELELDGKAQLFQSTVHRALEGTLSCWSWLHLQSSPTFTVGPGCIRSR